MSGGPLENTCWSCGILGLIKIPPEKRQKRDYRQANRHAKLGHKKKKNGKSTKGKSAVQETKKLTDEQTDS
jgi:hypothetical protein